MAAASLDELRPLKCEFGVLERADGSVRVSQGETIVLAAVYGPAEVRVAKEISDRSLVEVQVKPARGQGGVREKLWEDLLRGCCEECVLTSLHPHTSLSIILQIVTNDGSILSTLCLALCLALIDSGVPVSSPFSGVSYVCQCNGDIITDPTLDQTNQSEMTVMSNCSTGHIISIHSTGAICSTQQLEVCLTGAEKIGHTMLQFYKKAIHRRLSKDAKFSHLNIAI